MQKPSGAGKGRSARRPTPDAGPDAVMALPHNGPLRFTHMAPL
jgi:hypothetical protein